MESRDMTSWWSRGYGSPAPHNWNNGARCQKSRRHIMHRGATNVRRSIDRKMADWWQRWSISLGSSNGACMGGCRSAVTRSDERLCRPPTNPPAAHLQGRPLPELLIRRRRARCYFRSAVVQKKKAKKTTSLVKPFLFKKKKNLHNL